MTKAKKEHYVNNKEFLEAMKAYKKSVNNAKIERLVLSMKDALNENLKN